MITKLALLSRMLPGIFHRLPAATSVGYRMPSERFFFYGISCSVALHAAVLYGIRTPPHVPLTVEPPAVLLAPIEFGAMPDDPPPPPPEPAPSSKEEEAKANDKGDDTPRFPEPTAPSVTPGLIPIDVRPDAGKAPNAGLLRWEVPRTPGTGSVNTGTKVFSPIDLDKIPVATSRYAPRYPYEMKNIGVGGTALLRFVVDSHGDVSDVEVVRADYPEFGKAAAEAILKWKFKAGIKNLRRVSTRMEMPMAFSLDKST